MALHLDDSYGHQRHRLRTVLQERRGRHPWTERARTKLGTGDAFPKEEDNGPDTGGLRFVWGFQWALVLGVVPVIHSVGTGDREGTTKEMRRRSEETQLNASKAPGRIDSGRGARGEYLQVGYRRMYHVVPCTRTRSKSDPCKFQAWS